MSDLRGVVLRSTGSWYSVMTEEGNTLDCRIKGKFRMHGIRSTNPVAVGDGVSIELEGKDEGVIVAIDDRKNYIVRKATNLSHQTHVLAANLDRTLLITTLVHPKTKLGFLDRFLVTAEAYNIPVTIVFNKVDLYDAKVTETMEELFAVYEPLGYQCLATSAIRGDNLKTLKALMKDQRSLVAGHSGVGKSTLINAIQPGLELKTGDISDYNQKGKHTTTFAEMFPLLEGGFIIDTPGIKNFGLVDIEKEELGHFFPEMEERMNDCKFNNCVHINEPGCAIKEAVEAGVIATSRYENYIHLYNGDDPW